MDTLLEQLDERIRRVVAEALASREEKPAPASGDPLDDQTRQAIREQAVIAHKAYLTRKEVAKYLAVSERAVADWAARPATQNPLPERRAGGEPRYKREEIDAWAEREARLQRLKLAG
ncbi:MAG TPA: helix-turn-helix domain-containing protein [Pyrinomonadaceae bacterium]|jgi:excisionase family DNA binding protein